MYGEVVHRGDNGRFWGGFAFLSHKFCDDAQLEPIRTHTNSLAGIY